MAMVLKLNRPLGSMPTFRDLQLVVNLDAVMDYSDFRQLLYVAAAVQPSGAKRDVIRLPCLGRQARIDFGAGETVKSSTIA